MNPNLQTRLTLAAINEQRAKVAFEKLIAIKNDLAKQNLGNEFHLDLAITHLREYYDKVSGQVDSIKQQLEAEAKHYDT